MAKNDGPWRGKMSYDRWLLVMRSALLAPDMPLLTPVGDTKADDLMRAWHKMGIKPERAATLFNRRFEASSRLQEMEEELDGSEEVGQAAAVAEDE